MTLTPTADLFNLKGKTAIVTGSGQGLGRGIAYRLADAGANIVVSHRHHDAAERTAAEIRERGGSALAVLTDVTELEQLDTTLAAAIDTFGGIDVLVNTVGGMHPITPFLEVSEETWTATMERNLKGTFFLTQKAAKLMVRDKRRGKIVNIASTAAFRPDYQLAAYNAAKAGVVSLTQSLCVELAPYGICINTVVPGPVRTTNTEAIYDLPEVKALIAQRLPLGAPAQPDNIANAVLFCASPASAHMTGGMIVVDGGWMWT
jgi:NAD(P)-dependent dehydrogenase (short-subunit alcohol dehydrogenase family)